MNAGKQALWLFTALIGLAFSSWYFASSNKVTKLDDATLATTVDIIIHELTVRQFNTEGKLTNILKTPLLHHIPQSNKHWLKSPYILVSQDNEKPWEIRSAMATSLHGGEEITFTDDVIIHQEPDVRSPASTVTTEELVYFPKQKLATTEKHVTFEQPGNIIQSEGMMAYLAEKRVKLLGNARGSYVPKQG